ncbi:hypothetical protein Ancab_014806 [Ancistrocladus abbreviatus]
MLRQQRSKVSTHYLLYSLSPVRFMGGGPRTFPGGINKWQWKRLHEKKAREKEKKLLEQEKQLYQARLRSQIRSKLAGRSESGNPSSDHNPMTPKDHIKALADRFVKDGAEDLWNDDDGPIHTSSVQRQKPSLKKQIEPVMDLRNLVMDGNNACDSTKRAINSVGPNGFYGQWQQKRGYSANMRTGIMTGFNYWRNGSLWNGNHDDRPNDSTEQVMNSVCAMDFNGNWQQVRDYLVDNRNGTKRRFNYRRKETSSSEEDDDDDDDDYGRVSASTSNVRWPKFSLADDNEGEEDEEKGEAKIGRNVKRFMSSAALGKYDVKITKRRMVEQLEEGSDDEGELSHRIEQIRREVNKRKLLENDVQKTKESILSEKRFEELDISPLTVKSLTSSGYITMTRVQEAALLVCLEGKDALVKARAGTGKSAAFLAPAIETVLKAVSCNIVQRVPPIYVLILCPTRELASQIAAETRVMLKYHDGLAVQALVGGTRFKDDQKRLESEPCQILIATPGRLLDHIESRSGLSVRLMGLKMLILDEADHLLNLGFRKDLERIVDCLPRQRQSLLFSATIPKEVRRTSQLVLKREHTFIDTVGAGFPETNSKVKQSYIVAPHEQHFQMVHQLLKEHISETPDYKVIVFCTTGMVTSLMYQLFREMQLNVREIHTRKSQLYRSRISDEFRQSKRIILISSDVSARGMNYPDVTLIIQVGIPSEREQYIHRLGRTGRGGKDGQGILLLAPWEEYFLDDLKDLPIGRSTVPHINLEMKVKMEESMAKIDTSVKEAAYHAWLGYYNSIKEIGRDKTTLVELASRFCMSLGLPKPPALFRKTALKMGLRDIPGIRIRK